MDPSEIDPKEPCGVHPGRLKLERENRMELEADTAPGKANEQADSSLAAVISEAWERRKQQNEPDK